jgi:hypothetical protein
MDKAMRNTTDQSFLDRPLRRQLRILLFVLCVPMALSFAFPLWKISLHAPQYPHGLFLEVYSYALKPGNNGQHLQEINTLNHYIGMHPINREALSDLEWLPFAFGFLIIFALRVAAIGNVRSLIDLATITMYVAIFAMVRFVYKLYSFGHDLAPDAPVKVEGFMPAVLGGKQIANFMTYSYPQTGAYLAGTFVVGVVMLLVWESCWSGALVRRNPLP